MAGEMDADAGVWLGIPPLAEADVVGGVGLDPALARRDRGSGLYTRDAEELGPVPVFLGGMLHGLAVLTLYPKVFVGEWDSGGAEA